MSLRPSARGLITPALLMSCFGCGPRAGVAPEVSSSLEEAAVKGTVRVRGKAVSDGMVLFSPMNVKRPMAATAQAPIGKDGTYTLKTLVGDNRVEVSSSVLDRRQNRELADNQQTIQVKEGENSIDIDVPPR